MHGFGVSPCSYARVNGSTIARLKSSRRSSVTWGTPSPWHVALAAATAAGEQHARSVSGAPGSCQSRSVTPIASSAGSQHGDGAVDAAAHRNRDAAGTPLRLEDLPDRGREGLDGQRLAPDRRRLDERQPGERPIEPGRVRGDDLVAVDGEARRHPVAATSRVPEDLSSHRTRLARKGRSDPVAKRPASGVLRDRKLGASRFPVLRPETKVLHPADELHDRCEPGSARWVSCGASATPSSDSDSLYVSVGSRMSRGHAQGRARRSYLFARGAERPLRPSAPRATHLLPSLNSRWRSRSATAARRCRRCRVSSPARRSPRAGDPARRVHCR